MRFAIVGAGAIGCLIGSRLQASGHEVLLIHHRKSSEDRIKKKGVTVREKSGRVTRQKIAIRQSLSASDDPDFVIVTVKAFDTDEAARLQLKPARPKTTVLTLQNGLGNVETLVRYVPQQFLIAGSTTEGVTSLAPGVVHHLGTGTTWIGELDGNPSGRCVALQRAFEGGGLHSIVSKDIRAVLWLKAIVNSAINPISALVGTTNSELLNVPDLFGVSIQVAQEGINLAIGNGIRLPESPIAMVKRVLASTAGNRSSMLQDIKAGRQTEIRQLNGILSETGKKLGVSTPYNQLLLKLVLGVESVRHR